VAVEVYYLEMTEPAALRPKPEVAELSVHACTTPQWRANRFLYELVGGPWQWTDRLVWSEERWRSWAERDELRTGLALVDGSIAGYHELERDGDEVEIASFGLAEPFIGGGRGGDFLTRTVRTAWAWPGTRRVWLHTCSSDHPSALANYQARGFALYRTERED